METRRDFKVGLAQEHVSSVNRPLRMGIHKLLTVESVLVRVLCSREQKCLFKNKVMCVSSTTISLMGDEQSKEELDFTGIGVLGIGYRS